MLPKDYVRFLLTGERAIDQADASGTLLLDVAKRTWSAEVLSGTGIEKDFLPALYESPEICGKLNAQGAAATGLKIGTPVVAGAGDQAAGAVGMGIVRAGVVSATIGTSGVVFAATDRPRSIRADVFTRFVTRFLAAACHGRHASRRTFLALVPRRVWHCLRWSRLHRFRQHHS